jgi:general secretion pathway protein G
MRFNALILNFRDIKEDKAMIYSKLLKPFFTKRVRAVTLAEVLVVITIMAILALLIFPKLAGKTEKARRTAALLDVESGIPAALDEFESDNGFYPSTEQGLKALIEKPSGANNWQGPYLKKKSILDPWGHPYGYKHPGDKNGGTYDLYSLGSDGKEGGEGMAKDIANWE